MDLPNDPIGRLEGTRVLNPDAPANLKGMDIAEQNQNNSQLLRLPPELRNQIFLEVLGGYYLYVRYSSPNHKLVAIAHPVSDFLYGSTKQLGRSSLGPYRTVARVCRQVYEDTALLPYSLNIFGFQIGGSIQDWLNCRTPRQILAIKAIAPERMAWMCIFVFKEDIFFHRFFALETLYLCSQLVRVIDRYGAHDVTGLDADQIDKLRIRTLREKYGINVKRILASSDGS